MTASYKTSKLRYKTHTYAHLTHVTCVLLAFFVFVFHPSLSSWSEGSPKRRTVPDGDGTNVDGLAGKDIYTGGIF